MSPYRCSECTLFRCDMWGDTCTECLANMPANLGIVAKPESAGVDFVLSAPGSVNPWKPAVFQVVPPAAPTKGKTSKTLVFNYGMNPVPAAPPAAPPAPVPVATAMPPGTYTAIPGDNKHNALVAATMLMSISWTDLKTYSIITGKPWHEISEVYRLLVDFANSP